MGGVRARGVSALCSRVRGGRALLVMGEASACGWKEGALCLQRCRAAGLAAFGDKDPTAMTVLGSHLLNKIAKRNDDIDDD